MVFDEKIQKEICNFVKIKPRSIQEISQHVKKNWRTIERYITKIEKETGYLSRRVFREGTRGALKIIFYNSLEEIPTNNVQEEILKDLLQGKSPTEFFPFDIYQHVPEKEKKAFIEDLKGRTDLEISDKQDLVGLLRKAKKQILIFAGNVTWINGVQGDTKIIDVLKELAEKGISIKILSRVSLIGLDNIKKILNINNEIEKEVIEIKHRYHPFRAIIIDDQIVRMSETKLPEHYPSGDLKKEVRFFYEIYDKEWVEWIQKVFWKMFVTSISSNKRIKEINTIMNTSELL